MSIFQSQPTEDNHHGHVELTHNLAVSLNPALQKRDLSGKVDVKSLFPTDPTCVLAPELTVGPYCTYTYILFPYYGDIQPLEQGDIDI